jgi:hypothetical protein
VGFSKNNRRDEILAILRRKEQRESGGKETVFTLRDGPVDLENVERYQKRNNIFDVDKRPVFGPLEDYHKDLVSRTPPQLPKAISVPQLWRIPEKFLFDIDICINNLFESGAWKFQGNELLIQSSEFQYFEQNSLHAFSARSIPVARILWPENQEQQDSTGGAPAKRMRGLSKAHIVTSYRTWFNN